MSAQRGDSRCLGCDPGHGLWTNLQEWPQRRDMLAWDRSVVRARPPDNVHPVALRQRAALLFAGYLDVGFDLRRVRQPPQDRLQRRKARLIRHEKP